MKYTRRDFLAASDQSISVDEWISVQKSEFLDQSPVKAVPECHITGSLHFDGKSRVTSDLHLEGIMTVLDSITDEDLDTEFEAESETVYSFDPVSQGEEDEEIVVVKKDTIDINPEIFQAIVFEAPMSITSVSREDYPKGNGWAVLSDQDKTQEEETDPRWAKLKDFQFNDD